MNRVLILGTLTLTTMMGPSGGEDIVGECTAEGCNYYIWEMELEEIKIEIGIEIVENFKGVLNIKQV